MSDGVALQSRRNARLKYSFALEELVTEPRFHDARLERFRRRFAGFGGLVRDYLACLTSDDHPGSTINVR